MITIQGLQKSFENKKILAGIDLQISDDSIFGLIGINGAGKSTFLRLLAGVLRADAGKILYDGEEIFENVTKKGELFLLPDDPFYSSDTTVEKLLQLYCAFYPLDRIVFEDFAEKFEIRRRTPLRNLSKGQKRQIFIAIALACRPRYLLLDEAFDGLDPLARLEFKRGLIELGEERQSTVIISSHSLRDLEDICSGFALLDGGRISESGDMRNALDAVHKFQVALSHEIRREDFPFPCLSFEGTGRVAKIVVRGNKAEILRQIEALSPLFVEELAVDLEELFLCEVKKRGYLQ